MSIINDLSIVQEKNGIKKVLNPDTGRYRAGEIFYINPADRTVTCVLYGCSADADRLIDKYAGQVLTGYYEDVMIKYSYVGLAKCSPEDEFDEEFGMRLARYRANRKREGDIKTVVHDFTKNVRIAADLLDKKVENSAKPPVNE